MAAFVTRCPLYVEQPTSGAGACKAPDSELWQLRKANEPPPGHDFGLARDAAGHAAPG